MEISPNFLRSAFWMGQPMYVSCNAYESVTIKENPL